MNNAYTKDRNAEVSEENLEGRIVASRRSGRVAMVIGNSKYEHEAKLKNAIHDMNDMSAALARLEFEVIQAPDLPKRQLEIQLRRFLQRASETETAVLYYAGHAVQINGTNFL